MPINWGDWSADAFARARAGKKPVLLSITTTWCPRCADMDRTSYADPAVAELIATRFVPIRVDADRRPDISNRYLLGGWPTTAFLTPDGDLLGGGTYVGLDRLPGVLRQVAETFAARGDSLGAAGRQTDADGDALPGASPEPSARTPDEIGRQVFETFDPDNGTFGGPAGFPHTAPIRLAMQLFRQGGAEDVRDLAITSLDALGWGGLYDEAEGGFFRCTRGPGWNNPEREKMLDVNAALLSLYVEAFDTFDLTRYRDRAFDVISFVQAEFADPDAGAWGASAVGHTVDRTMYTDWNGFMASAMLHAARAFQDDALRDFAIRSLERVVLQSYRPGAGVAHYVEGEPQARGLLDDHVSMILANLDAHDATDNIVYEMMAEELSHYILRVLWDAEAGGFFDRVPDLTGDVGLLRRRQKPFVANCEAARALSRVAISSGEGTFADAARRALDATWPSAAAQGPLAAHFALALREAGAR